MEWKREMYTEHGRGGSTNLRKTGRTRKRFSDAGVLLLALLPVLRKREHEMPKGDATAGVLLPILRKRKPEQEYYSVLAIVKSGRPEGRGREARQAVDECYSGTVVTKYKINITKTRLIRGLKSNLEHRYHSHFDFVGFFKLLQEYGFREGVDFGGGLNLSDCPRIDG